MNQKDLIAHLRSHSAPLEPLPTGERKRTGLSAGIFCVVFDLYGTLFISGSGDISLASKGERSPDLEGALASAGFRIDRPGSPWSEAYFALLDGYRLEKQRQGIPFPEVRIEEVWRTLIRNARTEGWLSGRGDVRLAIVDYECRTNPCWPMPGLEEILDWLRRKGIQLGIASNAQFYTPLLFWAFLNKPYTDCGFESGLSAWSYRAGEAKPSLGLYQILRDRLERAGLGPEYTLYVGNDLRNDIQPARELGFRTALFAGDARSLRWRREDPGCRRVQPDFLITDLRELREIVC